MSRAGARAWESGVADPVFNGPIVASGKVRINGGAYGGTIYAFSADGARQERKRARRRASPFSVA